MQHKHNLEIKKQLKNHLISLGSKNSQKSYLLDMLFRLSKREKRTMVIYDLLSYSESKNILKIYN